MRSIFKTELSVVQVNTEDLLEKMSFYKVQVFLQLKRSVCKKTTFVFSVNSFVFKEKCHFSKLRGLLLRQNFSFPGKKRGLLAKKMSVFNVTTFLFSN